MQKNYPSCGGGIFLCKHVCYIHTLDLQMYLDAHLKINIIISVTEFGMELYPGSQNQFENLKQILHLVQKARQIHQWSKLYLNLKSLKRHCLEPVFRSLYLWNAIALSHKIIDKLIGQRFIFRLSDLLKKCKSNTINCR